MENSVRYFNLECEYDKLNTLFFSLIHHNDAIYFSLTSLLLGPLFNAIFISITSLVEKINSYAQSRILGGGRSKWMISSMNERQMLLVV